MNGPAPGGRGALERWLGRRVRVACLAGIAIFLWSVSRFYSPTTGFTSLITIGDEFRAREVSALREVPHYIYDGSAGYDGAYYVQLALHPTLNNPELRNAIDNLPYRARRILFCWVAWGLGLGQPAWVVQAHALLNVLCWLALAVVLWRWFPPDGWENFLRWAGVMFSHGLCMSVRNSLVDGPSLLMVALALRWLENGRRGAGVATLALAGLGKETNLLAAVAAAKTRDQGHGTRVQGQATRDQRPETGDQGRIDRRSLVSGLWSVASAAALAAVPLLLWMAYVRWKIGPAEDTGLGNFALPLAGLAEKWGFAIADLMVHPDWEMRRATLGVMAAVTMQMLFFLFWRRPENAWWRVGAVFAVMAVFLSTPVWEGFPGASTRVLLPMLLAFNITVPRGRRWLGVLLAGNLSVLATYKEFTPPQEFFALRGDPVVLAALRVERTGGWHGIESTRAAQWRWSNGDSGLRFHNRAGRALTVTFRGELMSAQGERRVRVFAGPAMVSSEAVSARPREVRFGFVLAPGDTDVTFKSDVPGRTVGDDERVLAFQVSNLEIVVKPAPGKGS